MSKNDSPPKSRDRQIVGFSLAPELARKVKSEAGRRNLTLKKLFEEIWDLYEKQPAKTKVWR